MPISPASRIFVSYARRDGREAAADLRRRLLRTLEAPCQATRAPFMVEDLPEDFVPRHHELDQLVAALLDAAGEEPVAVTAALKGAGGYGKTTLARDLPRTGCAGRV